MPKPQDDSPRFEWDPTFAWFLVLFFLFNVGLGVFPPLLPQIMGDLQLSFAGTGLLGTAFGLFRFLVDLPAGYVLERLGPRIVLHSAAGLLLLGTALSVGMIALGPAVWVDILHRSQAIVPLRNPCAISMGAAIAAGILVSLVAPDERGAEIFAQQQRRIHLGAGDE